MEVEEVESMLRLWMDNLEAQRLKISLEKTEYYEMQL